LEDWSDGSRLKVEGKRLKAKGQRLKVKEQRIEETFRVVSGLTTLRSAALDERPSALMSARKML
jgi:hypothetical protein